MKYIFESNLKKNKNKNKKDTTKTDQDIRRLVFTVPAL